MRTCLKSRPPSVRFGKQAPFIKNLDKLACKDNQFVLFKCFRANRGTLMLVSREFDLQKVCLGKREERKHLKKKEKRKKEKELTK